MADSLSLTAFAELPEQEQAVRRDEARVLVEEADQTSRLQLKSRALSQAAGLDPADPDIWLGLAEVSRWQGDYLANIAALTSAAAAVRSLPADYPPEQKREAQRRTAVLRAWLHYDRAEYREALRWARAAEQASPGDFRILRIRGLIDGSLGKRSQAYEIAAAILRNDPGDPDAEWVLAAFERSQGNYREAFNHVDLLRPDHEFSAECYRDKGEIAEFLEEWAYARRWYAEAASSLVFRDAMALTEITHPRLEPGLPGSEQPVWLYRDRFYVTGSLSAYCALALRKFESSLDPVEREFWAGQVVDAAGTLLRKEMHRGWSFRARGLVFAEKDLRNRAMKDLKKARSLLAGQPLHDGSIEAALGHLYLVEEDHEAARPLLEEAVQLNPTSAESWSDLGLCHIMAAQRDLAEQALSRAVELDPELVTAWYNRGLMHFHAGNLDQAEADLGRAAQLAPDNVEVGRLLQQVKLRQRQGP